MILLLLFITGYKKRHHEHPLVAVVVDMTNIVDQLAIRQAHRLEVYLQEAVARAMHAADGRVRHVRLLLHDLLLHTLMRPMAAVVALQALGLRGSGRRRGVRAVHGAVCGGGACRGECGARLFILGGSAKRGTATGEVSHRFVVSGKPLVQF